MDVRTAIPRDKFDRSAVEVAEKIGFPALNAILPELLIWLKDGNWPVAEDLGAVLSKAEREAVPCISAILKSDDAIWKYWVIQLVVLNLRTQIASGLRDDLIGLATNPSAEDRGEDVDRLAQKVLSRLDL